MTILRSVRRPVKRSSVRYNGMARAGGLDPGGGDAHASRVLVPECSLMTDRLSLWTRAVAGEPPDPATGAIGSPVVQATSFVVRPGEVGFSAASGRRRP